MRENRTHGLMRGRWGDHLKPVAYSTVNPYDIDGTADAIRRALALDPDERKLRMQRMRKFISEHNIYRWAGNLIAELCEVRTDATGKKPEEAQTSLSAA